MSPSQAHSGRSMCKRRDSQPTEASRRAGPLRHTGARGELEPFSNMTGAKSVYYPRHKGISKVVYFQFKIKLRWHIHREYFEFCLTPDPKRGNYSKNLIKFGFKFLLGDSVQ